MTTTWAAQKLVLKLQSLGILQDISTMEWFYQATYCSARAPLRVSN